MASTNSTADCRDAHSDPARETKRLSVPAAASSRVFFEFGLTDGFLLGRIGYKGQSAIVQLISHFHTHMGIASYVLVPTPAVSVREPTA